MTSDRRIQTWLFRSLRRPRLTSSYASSFLPRQLRVKPFMANVSGKQGKGRENRGTYSKKWVKDVINWVSHPILHTDLLNITVDIGLGTHSKKLGCVFIYQKKGSHTEEIKKDRFYMDILKLRALHAELFVFCRMWCSGAEVALCRCVHIHSHTTLLAFKSSISPQKKHFGRLLQTPWKTLACFSFEE